MCDNNWIEDYVNSLTPSDLPGLIGSGLTILACAEQVSFPRIVYPRNTPEIRLLPPVYQWEFTRRHPYYLCYQPLAALYWAFAGGEAQTLIRRELWGKAAKAAAVLRDLGCLGPYPHASHDGRKMTFIPHNHPPFSNPTAHPVSLLYLATCLLLRLPKRTRKAVGRLLAGEGWETEANPTEATPVELAAGLAALKRLDLDNEDLTLDRPIPDLLAISSVASEKGVLDTVRSVLRQLKSQLDLPDQRRLSEAQLDAYLQVWDLREGWVEGRYEWKRTKRFQDVARETSTPLGTVKNRYRAAFRYITGKDYTPDLFAAQFGPLACHESKWSGWRRSKQRAEPGAPRILTNIAAGGDEQGRGSDLLGQPWEGSYDPQAYIDLKNDLLELTQRGHTAEQIAAKLEIPAEHAAALLEYFREHGSEDV
jgi:hypothetical protein